MRKTFSFLIAFAALCGVSHASISWGVGTVLTDENGALLPAEPIGPTNGGGYFVQLLWTGPNNALDAFDKTTTTGAGVDDEVIGTTFIGAGYPIISRPDGLFKDQFGVGEPAGAGGTGANYYIRAFNAPSNLATETDVIATTGQAFPTTATHYGDSTTLTSGIADANTDENFLFDGFQTTQLVPEPSSMILLGLGAGLLAWFRRNMRG